MPRHAAGRAQAGRARAGRAGVGLALAAGLVAACSSPGHPASSPSTPASSGALGQARHAVQVFGSGGGPVISISGTGGGYLAVPASAGSGGRPKITVGPIPPADSNKVVSLPLDTYANVAFSQQTVLAEADTLLTQKCMVARGFVYSTPASPAQVQQAVQQAEYPFGVTSLTSAATYGYGQPKSPAGPGSGPAFLGGFASFGDLAKQPRAWTVALLGFAPGARISPDPQAGCLSQASTQLYGSRGGLSDPVPSIALQAASWTQSDPRVEAVDAAWSRCMAARGYKYNTPLQAADAHWPSKPTPAETATAQADVTCKQAVNLDNTWLAVEAAYQSALIGQDLTTLANLQDSFKKMLQRAEALLSLPFVPSASQPGRAGKFYVLSPVVVSPAGR